MELPAEVHRAQFIITYHRFMSTEFSTRYKNIKCRLYGRKLKISKIKNIIFIKHIFTHVDLVFS